VEGSPDPDESYHTLFYSDKQIGLKDVPPRASLRKLPEHLHHPDAAATQPDLPLKEKPDSQPDHPSNRKLLFLLQAIAS
jgi:hypothetical protein